MSEHRRDSTLSQIQTPSPKAARAAQQSAELAAACSAFLRPLLRQLDRVLDRRLVETLRALVLVLLCHRHRSQALLLSELGGYLLSPAHAPAGTKRLSRLLHAPAWTVEVITQFLWNLADQRIQQVQAQDETPLVIWDESVLEKAESLKLEGLGPVRSTKAARLRRIKPGFFNPPGGRPIFVPGLNWLAVLVAARQGPATLAHLRWWTTRGPRASDKRSEEWLVLAEASRRWGRRVLHIWDRGFAGAPWLALALGYGVRFVVRWPLRYHVRDEQRVERPLWQVTRGKRSWEHRLIWDARRQCWRKVGVIAARVYDVELRRELTVVVSRPGPGRKPWYLLTNEPIPNAAAAWQIVFAYARRWQVEMAIRFQKCELGAESPRLWKWEARCKLLGVVALAYACLLLLLQPAFEALGQQLLRAWCHRTGKRSREVSAPLYRLRMALARLWLAYPPPLLARLNSG